MHLQHERADYGYSIERTSFGFAVRGWGRPTRADAHRWARDMRRAVRGAGPPPYDVLVDVRGHAPYDHDPVISGAVRETMAWCQEHGVRRSAVVSDDPALLLLTRGLAQGAGGVYPAQRYFNALHNPRWEADARQWLATGEELHWLRPEEARAELLTLVDALAEAVALFAADGRLLRGNPALARQLGVAGGASAAAWEAALARDPLGAAVADAARPPVEQRAVAPPDGVPWRVQGRAVTGLFGPETLVLVTAAMDVRAPLTDVDLARDLRLTPREREVARLTARGASNVEVAAALGVSRATVRNHMTSVLRKAGVPNRTRLADLLAPPGRG